MQKFDSSLDDDHQVGVKLVSSSENTTFYVSEISHSDPNLIIFDGFTQEGEPIKLIQNVSQISLRLIPFFAKGTW